MAVATVDTTLNAGQVVGMLRRHYLPDGRPPSGLFAAEIGSPCGKRRADAIWMPATHTGGLALVGHEVKVSRADLLAELADPAKADPWAQYCTRWWLVLARPDLADGLGIPEAWGIMAPPSGRRTRTMTIVRPAPKLTPRDPAPGFARLAAWQLYATEDRFRNLASEKKIAEDRAERLQKRVDTLAASGATATPEGRQVANILHKISERVRRERIWFDLDEDAAVDAIINHHAVAKAAEATRCDLQTLINQVEGIVKEPMRFALTKLRAAQKLGVRDDGEPA